MKIRAYSKRGGVTFISLCSAPYKAMEKIAEQLSSYSEKVPFLRFFERGGKIRLTLAVTDKELGKSIAEKAAKAGGRARVVPGCTLCTLYSMGCRRGGAALGALEICEKNGIEVHHMGITDTEVLLCINSSDAGVFCRELIKIADFTT